MPICVVFIILLLTSISVYVAELEVGVRQRFARRFNQICSKYPFVQAHINNFGKLLKTSQEYVIFVFHEPGSGSNGGLGDRLAGLISSYAFAIRTNRTFLVSGDKEFEEYFQPYHTLNAYSWSTWDWAGWKREFSGNMTYLQHCVNPRSTKVQCALDRNYPTKVVKYRGNRAYLCRWASKPSLNLQEDILQSLGVNITTDLLEVAGCLLRLAMWPTQKFWDDLSTSMSTQLEAFQGRAETVQIGFHFRCGDTSFTEHHQHKNPQCFYNKSVEWKGTSFMDDKSLDSPVDLGSCGRVVISEQLQRLPPTTNQSAVLAYIASDNQHSSEQIKDTLNWSYAMRPPQACHVDTGAQSKCTSITLQHWFMLALSNTIVTQALAPVPAGQQSIYQGESPEGKLNIYNSYPEEAGPVSAFSRSAAMYALSPNILRYGRDCVYVNKTRLSRQTQGNWICDPHTFY